MTHELTPFQPPRQLRRIGSPVIPRLFAESGAKSSQRFVEFFTATIRNKNTRIAYAHAVKRFGIWCDQRKLHLPDLNPFLVAAYVEQLGRELAKPSVKQHLAAIRMLFDYLVTGQVVPFNPAHAVRGPKHVLKKGTTPVLSAKEARQLLDAIDHRHDEDGRFVPIPDDELPIIALRDRALIGVMVYSFARVGAVVTMNREDYFRQEERFWFRLHEKGGKLHDVPAHHTAERYVNAYLRRLEAADTPLSDKLPLFRTVDRRRRITQRRMNPREVLAMIKRRAAAAGLPSSTCCHTFRATGITAYLDGGGTIEHAQRIAAHESPRTTKLYDRTGDQVSLDEVERIVI